VTSIGILYKQIMKTLLFQSKKLCQQVPYLQAGSRSRIFLKIGAGAETNNFGSATLPRRWYFFALPVIGQNLLLMHSFWSFWIDFTLLTDFPLYLLSVLHFPSHFLLFLFLIFIICNIHPLRIGLILGETLTAERWWWCLGWSPPAARAASCCRPQRWIPPLALKEQGV
jgi:hypothetical protein